mmetsp:Transcript_13358/g.29012  ORF Transcript_13358/g.29012 Transcript_13358/m.29012 type:complete len:582 (+) Transcript_13358:375-2120(+)|eukprot:CAMPEP_0172317600 /NCGR_PEP_ID=MMETSP1058-20130122/32154_1 /TAXON_ID=83371 /ORGANISM="Detonula confervacea, Strain CCMP 353" /LENGTH=581 /DNA_ID=CAMNT_0013032205 /DNA_START=455 /DNA_END=2200 /DNA_ORIENTATION=+
MISDVITRGGCIILLDVPPGSAITLDGVTRVTPASVSAASTQPSDPSAPFHRGLWIISNIDSNLTDDFHLLIVRSGIKKDGSNASGDCRNLPVGFVLSSSKPTTPTEAGLGHEWVFARRYDQYTEEISNEPVDELTLKNISMAMKDGGELAKFVISYDQFMGPSTNNNCSAKNSSLPSWETRTSLINARYLQQHHCIYHGNKIVPSSESDNQDDLTKDVSAPSSSNLKTDGTSISYPPIPCIDQTISARQLAQHCGTRSYLSKLSPEKRTWLLSGTGTKRATDTESKNPGEYVWRDVLCRYYGGDDCDISKNENDFLADVELSFLLFLFLECHASLEHWRDAVSMCSLSTTDAMTNIVIQRPQFFQKLLSVLYHQLSCIETEFFRDVEYSSGENNFMVGALRRLCNACECVGKRKREGDTMVESLKSISQKLRQLVRDRFGLDLSLPEDNDDMEMDTIEPTMDDYGGISANNEVYENQEEEEEDDEEDGPVIIPYDQIEASLERSTLQTSRASKWHGEQLSLTSEQQRHRKEYPLLHAAMSPGEDEVMACARILDEAKDVSLVREAAAYLEEVEAHRGGSF